jgi:hypothetical protein
VTARSKTRALSFRTLDRGFESRIGYGCLSLVCVMSCVGRDLARSWSHVQEGTPYIVKADQENIKGNDCNYTRIHTYLFKLVNWFRFIEGREMLILEPPITYACS